MERLLGATRDLSEKVASNESAAGELLRQCESLQQELKAMRQVSGDQRAGVEGRRLPHSASETWHGGVCVIAEMVLQAHCFLPASGEAASCLQCCGGGGELCPSGTTSCICYKECVQSHGCLAVDFQWSHDTVIAASSSSSSAVLAQPCCLRGSCRALYS